MEQYVGLDVSLKETFVCVVNACSEVVCEKSVGTTPETIAEFIEKRAPGADRFGERSVVDLAVAWVAGSGVRKPLVFGTSAGSIAPIQQPAPHECRSATEHPQHGAH